MTADLTRNAPIERKLLTPDDVNKMTEDELYILWWHMATEQFAHTVKELTPCCHEYTAPGEPHGMHSDDGWDYLAAALDLAAELHQANPHMISYETFRAWLLDKLDLNSATALMSGYACDGISPILWEMLYDEDADNARLEAEQAQWRKNNDTH